MRGLNYISDTNTFKVYLKDKDLDPISQFTYYNKQFTKTPIPRRYIGLNFGLLGVVPSSFKKFEYFSPGQVNTHSAVICRYLTHKLGAPDPILKNDGFLFMERYNKDFINHWRKTTNCQPITMWEMLMRMKKSQQALVDRAGLMDFKVSGTNYNRYRNATINVIKDTYNITVTTDEEIKKYANKPMFVTQGLIDKYSIIKPFAKAESIHRDKYPRNISGPKPECNMLQQQYTKPLQAEWFKTATAGKMYRNVLKTATSSFTSKGMNVTQVANTIMDKFNNMNRLTDGKACVVLMDYEGYDTFQTSTQMEMEIKFKQAAYPAYRSQIKRIFSPTTTNQKGRINGMSFKRYGGRLSGTVDTSFGNNKFSLDVNAATAQAYMEAYGDIHMDVFVNGDDAQNFMSSEVVEHYVQFAKQYVNTNFGLRVECDIVYNWKDIEFCQNKIVRITENGLPSYIMVPNPTKVANTFGSLDHMTTDRCVNYISQVTSAYSILYNQIPIFRHLNKLASETSVKTIDRRVGVGRKLLYEVNTSELAESEHTLLDFVSAFKLPLSVVQDFEKQLIDFNHRTATFVAQSVELQKFADSIPVFDHQTI